MPKTKKVSEEGNGAAQATRARKKVDPDDVDGLENGAESLSEPGEIDLESYSRRSAADTIVKVRAVIRGLPPGIMFQGKGIMEAEAGGAGKKVQPKSAMEEAILRAHWINHPGSKKELCIPWTMIYQSLCTAGAAFKWRGRKTMATVIASTVTSEIDRLPLGTDKFECYEDFVRIPPKTGAMVKIGRPRVYPWQVTLPLVVDAEIWNVKNLEAILAHAGKLIGIGAWRPDKRGAHGKFILDEFEILG